MNNSAKKVIIVLPAYNAAKTLVRTYEEIPISLRQNVILVDDASTDNTVEVAKSLGIEVIVHSRNKGYGGNQKTCYTAAINKNADVVVMLHPDHQYDATMIPKLINPILSNECDAVFGSRMLGGKPLEGGMPYWKYLANVFLTAFANIVFCRYLSEIHSGFRAYSRYYLESVDFEKNSDDFIFDTQIIAQGMIAGLSFQEIPIVTRYFEEASSINFQRSVKYGFGILKVLFDYILVKKLSIRVKYLTIRV